MAAIGVKLLGIWSSPFVLRARIALNIKSINYEFIEENLLNKSELLLKSNPIYKKIPVLIHTDKSICESLLIVQYIDEAWTDGPSILPSDPYDRAIARFWAAYIDDTFFASLLELRVAKGEEAKAKTIEKIIKGLVVLEEAFVKCSKGKAFFGGDSIGYVDIAFGCFLGSLRIAAIVHDIKFLDEAKTPNLVAWAERFCNDAAVKDVMPETERLFQHVKLLKIRQEATSN